MPERKSKAIANARDAIIFRFGGNIGLIAKHLLIVIFSTWKDALWSKRVYTGMLKNPVRKQATATEDFDVHISYL